MKEVHLLEEVWLHRTWMQHSDNHAALAARAAGKGSPARRAKI